MNSQFYSHTVHDEVQTKYLVPVVHEAWKKEQQRVVQLLKARRNSREWYNCSRQEGTAESGTTDQGKGQCSSHWRWAVRFTRLLGQILHTQSNACRNGTDRTVRACASDANNQLCKNGMELVAQFELVQVTETTNSVRMEWNWSHSSNLCM